MISECCSALIISWIESILCSECLEHCDVQEYDEEEENE